MKCFNHMERDAVAYCVHCGKGLCRECAGVYTPCMCEPCAQAVRQNERHRLWQEDYDRKEACAAEHRAILAENKRCSLIGLVTGGLLGYIYFYASTSTEMSIPWVLFLTLFGFVFGYCTPFGWNLAAHIQRHMPRIWLIGSIGFWIVWFLIKFMVCFWLGIPGFIYLKIKCSKARRELNALQLDA